MGVATALEIGSQVGFEMPRGFRGPPALLAVLCLMAAGAGAAIGAMAGSSSRDRAAEDGVANTVAARAATLQLRNTLESRYQARHAELMDELGRAGLLQETQDLAEANKLGLARVLEADLARLPGDDGRRVLAALVREGHRNGLDPLLIAAVIRVETHFDPYAMSGVGARGLMQLMPATAIDLAHKRGQRLEAKQLFNAVVNIELGAAYLKYLIDRFGDVRSALIAYNAGPSVARARNLTAGVRAYPRNVLAQYDRLTWQVRKGANQASSAVAAR